MNQFVSYNDGDKEVRVMYYMGLWCPNPREYYRNTRSFEQMKQEYDLLTCHQVKEEDVLKVALAVAQAKARRPQFNMNSYITILGVICSILFALL